MPVFHPDRESTTRISNSCQIRQQQNKQQNPSRLLHSTGTSSITEIDPFNNKMSASTTVFSGRTNPRILALFDVDGTLTIPRGEVTEDMMSFMKELSSHVVVGIVGGTFYLR